MLTPLDCSLLALRRFFKETDILTDFLQELTGTEQEVDYLNLFTPLHLLEHLEWLVITSDLSEFRKLILDRGYCRDQIEYIQRLCSTKSS